MMSLWAHLGPGARLYFRFNSPLAFPDMLDSSDWIPGTIMCVGVESTDFSCALLFERFVHSYFDFHWGHYFDWTSLGIVALLGTVWYLDGLGDRAPACGRWSAL